MKKTKKLLSLALSMILVLSAFIAVPVSFSAQEDELITGTFTLDTFDGYDPGELDYYYSDSYFSHSGKEEDPHLRTMSAVLAFSIDGTSDTPDETYGKLLTDIGFSDVAAYDMDHTAMDSMGVVFAHKMIGDIEVVAVALRGDAYGVEMAANLIADAEGDIRAFADAEALVQSRLTDYLTQYGITSAKYWVVGYSRAGAVANLLGREMNKDPDLFRTTGDDIYVYTLEAAISSADGTAYENIRNITDLRDLVVYVYPAAWSLFNSGIPSYIGDTDETITLKVFDLSDASHSKDAGEIRTSDFLKDFVDFLGTSISRETYAEKLQTPVSGVLKIYYSLSGQQRAALIEYFKAVFSSLMADDTMLTTVAQAIFMPTSPQSVDDLTALLIKHMDLVAEVSGKPLDDESYAYVQSAIRPVVEVMLPIVNQDMQAEYDCGDGSGPEMMPMYHIMTFAGNLSELIGHHFNYRVFAELAALDPYYLRDVILLGDTDGDGEVTILDATCIQRKLAAIPTDEFVEEASDADGDGEFTILDATAVQRWLANLPSNDSIGEPIA